MPTGCIVHFPCLYERKNLILFTCEGRRARYLLYNSIGLIPPSKSAVTIKVLGLFVFDFVICTIRIDSLSSISSMLNLINSSERHAPAIPKIVQT
jgi:hypothetical protein